MHILISGGLGFIGSHTTVELIEAGHKITIVDNLVNSNLKVLERIEEITGIRPSFRPIDCQDKEALFEAFKNSSFDGIIHFAAYKAVGESVEHPIKYYENNIYSTLNLADFAVQKKISSFVFSSSCTVYGEQPSPFTETLPIMPPTNPYGATKQMSEQILSDITRAHPNFKVTLLRYFNPIGAHPSGLIGETPNGIPNNLMPYLLDVAAQKRDVLNVYGNDYPTPDGTGVRDYIHVVDLAKAHVKAVETMINPVNIYNVGTGQGSSVLDVIQTFERVNQVKVPYIIQSRRPGDIAESYANADKINQELEFKTTLTLEDMVRDAWHFIKTSRND